MFVCTPTKYCAYTKKKYKAASETAAQIQSFPEQQQDEQELLATVFLLTDFFLFAIISLHW